MFGFGKKDDVPERKQYSLYVSLTGNMTPAAVKEAIALLDEDIHELKAFSRTGDTNASDIEMSVYCLETCRSSLYELLRSL